MVRWSVIAPVDDSVMLYCDWLITLAGDWTISWHGMFIAEWLVSGAEHHGLCKAVLDFHRRGIETCAWASLKVLALSRVQAVHRLADRQNGYVWGTGDSVWRCTTGYWAWRDYRHSIACRHNVVIPLYNPILKLLGEKYLGGSFLCFP